MPLPQGPPDWAPDTSNELTIIDRIILTSLTVLGLTVVLLTLGHILIYGLTIAT